MSELAAEIYKPSVMRAIITVIALSTACASVQKSKRRWTGMDIALETAFVGAVLMDAEQTAWNNKLGDMRCGESNPVLGPCGDRVPVDVYVPAALLLHTGASFLIPHGKWRTAFQALTVGFEAAVIYGNYVLGYDTAF